MPSKDFIPRYSLSSDQRTWLETIWKHLKVNGSIPSYRAIRNQTSDLVSKEFNPLDIPQDLVKEKATRITIIGLLHVEDEAKLLGLADRILNCIKKNLSEDAEKEEFDLEHLAKSINEETQLVRVMFQLMREYGHFYNSASSRSSQFGYDTISISDDDTFEFYRSFESFENELEMYFKKLESTKAGHQTTHFRVDYSKYIDGSRLQELRNLKQEAFDLSKLFQMCDELNSNFISGNFISVALLNRVLIDHVPPLFGFKTFKEFVNNYKSEGSQKSFKKSMEHLEASLRPIGDSHNHSLIGKSVSVPTKTQVNFSSDIDVLLGEIVRRLKT